jgi:hypothetical protein
LKPKNSFTIQRVIKLRAPIIESKTRIRRQKGNEGKGRNRKKEDKEEMKRR